jgi:type III secretion protein C
MNNQKIKKNRLDLLFKTIVTFLLWPCFAYSEVDLSQQTHDINFKQVPITEFIRFVSKISEVNFIFDNKDLQFDVSFSSGKSISGEDVLKALVQILRVHGFGVMKENGYYVVHKLHDQRSGDISDEMGKFSSNEPQKFSVFKLQYHQGSEIQDSIKKIAVDIKSQPGGSSKILDAIQSMQWVKATNSLLCSGDEATLESLKSLVSSLDIPLRQVFIEILVIETDVRKGLDFGLQWGIGGKYKERFGGGGGNFNSDHGRTSFARSLQGDGGRGFDQIPVGNGFDLGVIGDIIMHKGTSYLTLGALVSALQADKDSTIVLNQKIITQDNKNSKIFVGDNIPFPGSVVQTVGNGQQTTSNIDYRDIGVSLSITPMLGEGDIITLDLDEEISEAVNTPSFSRSSAAVNGIRSTKTNMVTHVHVPDKHFLVLSGMVRNTRSLHKEGLPCLGGIPFIGALFSRTQKEDEKRNVIVFVRPHIIHSFEDYSKITEHQVNTFQNQANSQDFQAGLDLVNDKVD